MTNNICIVKFAFNCLCSFLCHHTNGPPVVSFHTLCLYRLYLVFPQMTIFFKQINAFVFYLGPGCKIYLATHL